MLRRDIPGVRSRRPQGNGENRRVARAVVIREANEAGYHLLEQEDFVKDGMDYSLVFGAK